jgi:SAM-dependent methyltransferase
MSRVKGWQGRPSTSQLGQDEEQDDDEEHEKKEIFHAPNLTGVWWTGAMAWWTEHVVPRLADAALKGRDVGEERAVACAPLYGRVLELGFGGGLNVRWYPDAVESVHAVEPSDVGWALSERRRARATIPVERRGLDGQRLDEASGSYDCVLSTFTLCTIPDIERALSEVVRVLKPGGVFAFLEHGLSPEVGVARWQRRLEPLQRRCAGGCHLTRDVPAQVQASGLVIETIQQHYLAGPSLGRALTYLTRGAARAT